MVQIFYLHYLCSQKMKRIDFTYGVISLTIFLLSPLIFDVFGNLDSQTLVVAIGKDSFNEKPIKFVYPSVTYGLIVFIFCNSLLLLFVSCDISMGKMTRFQIRCYRPYFLLHCLMCLVLCILRYVNMTAKLSDDVMAQVSWIQIVSAVSSAAKFILSFLLSVIRKYKFLRLLMYLLITVIHSFIITFAIYILCSYFADLISSIKEIKNDFLTEGYFFDQESLNSGIHMNKENTYVRTFILDENLFRRTGKKAYQTISSRSYQLKDKFGITPPYKQEVYAVGIGESVNLSCIAISKNAEPVCIMWSLNNNHPHLKGIACDKKTNVESTTVFSQLEINFIDNNSFGNFTCSFQQYRYIGEKLYFHQKEATPVIESIETVIAQYNIKKYPGKESYIYATPGGAISIRWKPMIFHSEIEDIIQYYYVNGVPYNRPKTSRLSCSIFSYLYLIYGEAVNWFSVPLDSVSAHLLVNYRTYFETRFVDCAGSSVFGIHTVEYFRRVYDKRSQSYVLREVKHPDTIYVIPDLPYFYKMDNVTKAEKNKIIHNLRKLDLNYHWFENSHTCFLMVRVVFELVLAIIWKYFTIYILYKCWILYGRIILQPIRNCVLGQDTDIMTDLHYTSRTSYLYTCYIICGNTDRDSAFYKLVLPLRKENITTGFIFEECSFNKSGKSMFDIQCDLLGHCEHLIFYVTTSYLEEEKFADIQLETILHCIKMGFISPKSVLIIIADNCELPDKIRYNLPEAAVNIHDWVTTTWTWERIDLISEWIKRKKEPQSSEMVVSTLFLG